MTEDSISIEDSWAIFYFWGAVFLALGFAGGTFSTFVSDEFPVLRWLSVLIALPVIAFILYSGTWFLRWSFKKKDAKELTSKTRKNTASTNISVDRDSFQTTRRVTKSAAEITINTDSRAVDSRGKRSLAMFCPAFVSLFKTFRAIISGQESKITESVAELQQ